jgi:membrane protein
MNMLARLSDRIDRVLWNTDIRRLPTWKRVLIQLARFVHAIARELTEGLLNLQAMSLVYTTLLSLVPLLAVSFSVLKGFGAHYEVEPMLLNALSPLGEQGAEITAKIIEFVDNMSVGVLGSVGLAMLLYTVISLIQKIEQAFNYTWHVAKARGFAERFSHYLSVLLVGPVLFFTAIGLTASVRSNAFVQTVLSMEPMGTVLEWLGRLVPYLVLSATFAFVYVFVPNTRVRARSAMIGGLVAAALWQTVGWGFAAFMANSTRYAAIYSGMAIAILFMIWVYIAWLILLIGASIAFYHQHPEYLASRTRELTLSNRLRERLALLVASQVARSYYEEDTPWSADALAKVLFVPRTNIQDTLDRLQQSGFVLPTAEEPPCYVPAHAPETIRIDALLSHVRGVSNGGDADDNMPPDPAIAAVEKRIDNALEKALHDVTLRDLAARRHEARSSTDGGTKSDPSAC